MDLLIIRPTLDGGLIGQARDGGIKVWSADGSIVAELPAIKVSSEGRIIASKKSGIVVHASWGKGLFATSFSGEKLWKNRKMRGIQRIEFADSETLLISKEMDDHWRKRFREPVGIVEVRVKDGRIIGSWKETSFARAFTAPGKNGYILVDKYAKRVRYLDADKKPLWDVPMPHFTVLDVAFGDDLIGLADGPKGLRVLTKSGETALAKGSDGQVSRLAFVGQQCLVYDSWDKSVLEVLDFETGQKSKSFELPDHAPPVFFGNRGRYAHPTGAIYDAFSGELIGQLEQTG